MELKGVFFGYHQLNGNLNCVNLFKVFLETILEGDTKAVSRYRLKLCQIRVEDKALKYENLLNE